MRPVLEMILEVVVIMAISSLPFTPGIQDEFIFDDRPAILENKVLKADTVTQIFYKDFWGENILSNRSHKSYRPITSVTYWLQMYTHNLTDSKVAVWMKQVNLVINTINSLLSLFLLKTWFPGSSWLPISTAAIFSIHPVHVEPVVSIVGRADLLYSFFFLSGLLMNRLLAQRQRVLRCLCLFLLAGISMLCKEQGVLLLPMVLALEVSNLKERDKKNFAFVSCILCCLFILVYFRLKIIDFQPPVFREEDNPFAFTKGLSGVLSVVYLSCLNLTVLILPTWLCFDWSMGCVPVVKDFADIRIIPILFFIVVTSGILLRMCRAAGLCHKNQVYLAVCLLVVPFLLCTNLVVRVGFVVAERNLYLSVLGLALLYHLGLHRMYRRYTTNRQRGCLLFFHLLVMCLLLTKSVHRSTDWQSERSLYMSGLEVCPNNAKVYYNLAKLGAHTDNKMTKTLYHHTIILAPRFEHALNNLANIYRGEGDLKAAGALLTRAVSINPQFPAAHMNLGIVLMNSGNFSKAREHYETALKLRYPYPDCTYNLGILHLKMERLTEAEQFFRLGVSQGHVLSHTNLIVLLDSQNRLLEAREVCESAVKMFPDRSGFRFQLANTLGQMEDYGRAEKEYITAINMEQKVSYILNLGVLYHRWGRYSSAAASYRSVLKLQQNHQKAKLFLSQVEAKLQK